MDSATEMIYISENGLVNENEAAPMTSGKLKAKIVRVMIEQGREGLFYATSPDLKGLLVAEPTVEALTRSIPDTIVALYAACDETVAVWPTDDVDGVDHLQPWVAVPLKSKEVAAGC